MFDYNHTPIVLEIDTKIRNFKKMQKRTSMVDRRPMTIAQATMPLV
jgi:hypothetical protein